MLTNQLQILHFAGVYSTVTSPSLWLQHLYTPCLSLDHATPVLISAAGLRLACTPHDAGVRITVVPFSF